MTLTYFDGALYCVALREEKGLFRECKEGKRPPTDNGVLVIPREGATSGTVSIEKGSPLSRLPDVGVVVIALSPVRLWSRFLRTS